MMLKILIVQILMETVGSAVLDGVLLMVTSLQYTVDHQLLMIKYWYILTIKSLPSKYWQFTIVGQLLTVHNWLSTIDSQVLIHLNHQEFTVQVLIVHYCRSTVDSHTVDYQLLIVKCWYIWIIKSSDYSWPSTTDDQMLMVVWILMVGWQLLTV